MCMGCMTNADFVLTSGIVGAASLRVGARQLLPRAPRWARRVSDDEAAAFVASLQAPEPVAATSPALVLAPEVEVAVDSDEALVPAGHADRPPLIPAGR